MNKHIGSSLESLFDELGERPDVELLTMKKILAHRIRAEMDRQSLTQTALATGMQTSRTVVHRLLDPGDTAVTLTTIHKASKALGVQLINIPGARHGADRPRAKR